MNRISDNPIYWRLDTLLQVGTDVVHSLAVKAAGTLTSYRLIVGRCLLAVDQSRAYKEFGYSSSIHFAAKELGMTRREARRVRLVAERLLPLTELTIAAENGTISWSKLREIVSKATPETETFWLALARKLTAAQIARLVASTPEGGLPGDPGMEQFPVATELRCPADPELFLLLHHARRLLSIRHDEALSTTQVLKLVLGACLAGEPLDEAGAQRLREETDKDFAAERELRKPLVARARRVAQEMGPLEFDSENDEPLETVLAQAVGAPALNLAEFIPVDGSGHWKNDRLHFNADSRHLTPAQKRELLRRDAYECRTPGCPHHVWLQVHHVKPYSWGGATLEENLVCLCTRCHKHVHEGYLKVELSTDGELVFYDKNGYRLDRERNLDLAWWIDMKLGWTGDEGNTYFSRAMEGSWGVFTPSAQKASSGP